MSSAWLSPLLAADVVREVAAHVTDVVLCPGSRNSPLSLAFLARSDVRVHVRHDERSAAFLALGLARVQRRHVGVVTTSGTAVANCFPAVVESAMSHTPLVVVSADRPQRFVGKGASQTIDQRNIFGSYAQFVDVTEPTDLVDVFTSPTVHINVRLDTPLVDKQLPAEGEPTAKLPFRPFVDHGQVELDLSKDTLVIAGDEAWEVDGLQDVPTIAEPTAPAPYYPVHPLAAGLLWRGEIATEGSSEYAEYVAKTKPEQLVIVGHPTLHRPVLALMADPSIEVTTLSRTETFTDPTDNATHRGTRVKTSGQPTKQWLTTCRAVSEVAAESVREVLADPQHGFTGLHVAAAIADGLGTGDVFVVGASNPVRDVSLVGLPFDGVDTYSPRGAAGIDGTVSQAVGVALATQSLHAEEVRAPRTVALLGDVTFLHDAGGLLIGPDDPAPENLTIVVANDNGGGIFESLEIGAEPLRPRFERAFGTPHEVDIESLCEAYGVNYRQAHNLGDLHTELAELTEDPRGITVVEAVVTRASRRKMSQDLNAAVGL